MKKKIFFKYVRNFLALWAGIVLGAFLFGEVLAMGVAFVENAGKIFEIVTEPKTIIGSMIVSLLFAAFGWLTAKKKKDK